MKRTLWVSAAVLALLAIGAGLLGYYTSQTYFQALLGSIAATLLGLAAAVVFVNYYLTQSEKGEAANPLLKLISPAVAELHNVHFVRHLRDVFGIDKMHTLISIYKNNKRNPKAFSPEQCDELHAAIMAHATELLRVYDTLIDQFRELSMITGWSFDPSITAAALEARLNFLKFKTLYTSTDQESKYQVVEAYLDGEAASTAVISKLAAHLGLAEEEWSSSF